MVQLRHLPSCPRMLQHLGYVRAGDGLVRVVGAGFQRWCVLPKTVNPEEPAPVAHQRLMRLARNSNVRLH